jgi:mono/diheme cytochrome c family protein
VLILGSWVLGLAWGVDDGWSQDTEPAVQVTRLKAHLDAADEAYRQQDPAKILEHVNQAVGVLEEILQATRREDVAEIRAQHKRLVAAHRLLKNLKAKPNPLPQLKFKYVDPAADGAGPRPEGISFRNAIAPLIAQKCGRCHVARASGGTRLATVADLNNHVFPGDSGRSYLYEIVANDTMPQGNNKLTAEEKRTLQQWIDQGAKLDVGLDDFDLRSLMPGGEPAAAEAAAVSPATENDTVFFSRQLAPLFVESCQGCHIQANNLRGGLSLDNFSRLLRGGDSGGLIVPGRPEDSLLIKKLTGMADGQQMPINRPKWTDEQIEWVRTWIREGARFDGLDPEQSVVELARRSAIESLSAEEINQRRSVLLLQHWKLALVDQPYQQGQTEHFDWIAGAKVDLPQIEQWVKLAEQEYRRREAALGIQPDNAFAKGRIALLIPESNYDYSEVAKMLSRREAGGRVRGYWDQSLEGPYLVVAASLSEAEVQEHLPLWIGSAMVANLAPGLPTWFCDSVAVALDEGRRGRPRAAPPAWSGAPSEVAQRWLEGRLEAQLQDAVHHTAAMAWRKQRGPLKEILQQLQSGQRLESLLQSRAGGSVADFVTALLQPN